MTNDKFFVKICLVITSLQINGNGAISVVTKDNELPSICVSSHNDDVDELAEGYFSRITKLSPQWANLKFRKFHLSKSDSTVVVFYSATLSAYDELFENFKWDDNIDSVRCYGLNSRSVIYV